MNCARTAKLVALAVLVCLEARADDAADARLAFEAAFLAQDAEHDRRAPVDYGFGPGVAKPVAAAAAAPMAVPQGSGTAGIGGMFGAPVTWPVVAIHVILLPDGRVMSYGTTEAGTQGAELVYDVWDPALGTGAEAHLVLPNTTATDIFCSGQSMMWSTGQAFITGGDLTIGGVRNFSNNHTTIFDPASLSLGQGPSMRYARWYASVVALPGGAMLVLGGRQSPTVYTPAPELFDPVGGWRTLVGATSAAAFVNDNQWYYPRGFLMSDGRVYVLTNEGRLFVISPSGVGGVAELPQSTTESSETLPTVMYQPGSLVSVRNGHQAVVLDTTSGTPRFTASGVMSQDRFWSNGTVLADGTVVVTGGTSGQNTVAGAAYQAETWNPATGSWALGAAAAIPRLYHSNALLLPDATVLTAGGGAPGPVINLNAEIYYPPYLYADDGSGNPAPRPSLAVASSVAPLGQSLTATVGSSDSISRVTFVRTGSSTHSQNPDQRFVELSFTQTGSTLDIAIPSNPNVVLPGYWMLFAINEAGVPSVAPILLVPSPTCAAAEWNADSASPGTCGVPEPEPAPPAMQGRTPEGWRPG